MTAPLISYAVGSPEGLFISDWTQVPVIRPRSSNLLLSFPVESSFLTLAFFPAGDLVKWYKIIAHLMCLLIIAIYYVTVPVLQQLRSCENLFLQSIYV